MDLFNLITTELFDDFLNDVSVLAIHKRLLSMKMMVQSVIETVLYRQQTTN